MKNTSTAGGRSSKKTSYHHGNLKNVLIQEALRQIAASGAHALSLREVARHAGVSHTSSYRHFRNKEDLLALIAEQGFTMLGDAISAAMDKEKDHPLLAFEASGIAYVKFGVEHPEHLQVMFGGILEDHKKWPDLWAAGGRAAGLLSGAVHAALQAGEIRGDESTIVLAAWSLVHGLTQLIVGGQVARGKQSTAQLANAVILVLRKGLQADVGQS